MKKVPKFYGKSFVENCENFNGKSVVEISQRIPAEGNT
jgi:hypothetical protein